MTTAASDTFEALVDLIKDVKPSLGDTKVEPNHSLVEDLGLDSLDLLQLARKINRDLGGNFDLDEWNDGADEHHRSVQSILDGIGSAATT